MLLTLAPTRLPLLALAGCKKPPCPEGADSNLEGGDDGASVLIDEKSGVISQLD